MSDLQFVESGIAGVTSSPASQPGPPLPAQGLRTDTPHCSCGAAQAQVASPTIGGWVYAIGRLLPQFPDLGVEKEFAQLGAGAAAGMLETNRLIDLLNAPGSAYLARQLCWVFHNQEMEIFTLSCREDAQAARLVAALPRAELADQTIQVIVGPMSYPAADSPCAVKPLPAVLVDHHLTFKLSEFIDALAATGRDGDKRADKENTDDADETFRTVARDLFQRLTRRSDNRGMSDEHRALNYIALRYPAVYHLAAAAQRDDKILVDVQVRTGSGATRRLVAVRPIFRARHTDVLDRYQCLVDVTDRFPFLASPLASVYD